jgi:Tfp pilus assembly protein PilN
MTLNLATQPFVNRRRFYTLTAFAASVLSLTLVVLLAIFVRNFRNEIGIRKQMKTMQQEIERLDTEQQRLESLLKRPEAADILDRNDFLNTLIRQKAISWTRIFMDLEKVMPDHVETVALHPVPQLPGVGQGKRAPVAFSLDGPLLMELQLQVSSQDFESLVKLVRHLENAPFKDPVLAVQSEDSKTGQGATAPFGQVPQYGVITKDKDNLYNLTLKVDYAQ